MKMIGIISGGYEDELTPQKPRLHPVYDLEAIIPPESIPDVHSLQDGRPSAQIDSKHKTEPNHRALLKSFKRKRMKIKSN